MSRGLKNVLNSALLVLLTTLTLSAQVKTLAYKAGQLKNSRVKEAYDTKWLKLEEDLRGIKIDPNAFSVYIRVFKFEKIVEVWLKNPDEIRYKFYKTYDICASSGDLGPKRKEGDGQIPEGFYRIELFNAKSNYYLSMKISYPNSSDLLLKEDVSPGSNIMIHGDCVTVGCIPLTDDKIKELYVLCLEARNRNTPIYIDIFPAKFTTENLMMMEKKYPKNKLNFWKSLKTAYDYFEDNKWLHKVNIDSKGHYFYEE